MKLAPEGGNLVVGEIFNIFSLAGNFRHRHPPATRCQSAPDTDTCRASLAREQKRKGNWAAGE